MSLEVYAAYLTTEKRMTDNTKQAYLRDLRHFSNFAEARGIDDPAEASSTDILAYLMELKTGGRSKSTVNRKLASLRTYYQYLIKMREIFENPTESIKSPKVEKKEIQYLTTEEIDRLLELPEDTAKGKRDRAILELLYATGIRASELIEMQIEEINIRMGFVKCAGTHGSARIIPIGKPCRHAMEVYVSEVRETLLKGKESESLFLNYAGNPFPVLEGDRLHLFTLSLILDTAKNDSVSGDLTFQRKRIQIHFPEAVSIGTEHFVYCRL